MLHFSACYFNCPSPQNPSLLRLVGSHRPEQAPSAMFLHQLCLFYCNHSLGWHQALPKCWRLISSWIPASCISLWIERFDIFEVFKLKARQTWHVRQHRMVIALLFDSTDSTINSLQFGVHSIKSKHNLQLHHSPECDNDLSLPFLKDKQSLFTTELPFGLNTLPWLQPALSQLVFW